MLLETQLHFNNKEYTLQRYPKNEDNSLRAWSNAELLALDFISDKNFAKVHTFNDRFGVWNCLLHNTEITTIWTYASQLKAIKQNIKENCLLVKLNYKTPLDTLSFVDCALIKIPKSLNLFELFLAQIHEASHKNTEVVCCFMTKYFSASYLKIASKYFDVSWQSKAWKKARLLVLKHPKSIAVKKDYKNIIYFKNSTLQQYYGVFSSDKIDIGTQFLLENLHVKPNELNILDVASGNGIIALETSLQNKKASLTLVDDFNLAIASSKLNLAGKKASFYCNNCLEDLPKNHFDLIVSNPPFHFEHENNIAVSINLFQEINEVLKEGGRFVMVANAHLNYKTHLSTIFKCVKTIASTKRFVIYECN